MKYKSLLIHLLTALVIFAQGLYFSDQWLIMLLVATIFLCLQVWHSGEIRWQWTPLTILLLVNVVLNTLGYLWYLEKGMLIFGFLRSLSYLIFAMLIYQLEEEIVVRIRQSFVLLMAIAGSVTVLIFTTGLFDGLQYIIDGRASGPIQYANTFGILLVAALMLSIDMPLAMKFRWPIALFLTVSLMLTMSRAIYMVGAVMILAQLILTRPRKATYLPVISSVLVGMAVIYFFDDSTTAARLTQTTGASEWHSRLLYYRDALVMIFDRPAGFGESGYHYAQSFYQTGSTYHVKFVHSGLIQAFLDRGIMGGLLVAGFMFWSVFMGDHGMPVRLVLTAILGHSLIDMNLQFPVVWLLMIVLLVDGTKAQSYKVSHFGPMATISVTIMLLSAYMLAATVDYSGRNYKSAINKYPYYTEAYRQLLKKNDGDTGLATYAEDLATMNPYVTESYGILGKASEEENDFDSALNHYRDLVYYSPLLIENHETYSHGLILAATYWHAYGQDEKALLAIEKILGIPASIDELAKERHSDYNVKHKPDLRMTAALMKDYEEAAYLKSRIEESK